MPKSWKRRAILVLIATLLGIYLLVPTVFKFRQERETLQAKGRAVPWYIKVFPDKVLNLGLDLRGGIYIEMQVDIPSAVKRRADLLAIDIEQSLKSEKIDYETVFQPKDDGVLHIRLRSSSDVKKVEELITRAPFYRDKFVVQKSTMENGLPTVIIGFNDEFRKEFEQEVVKQAAENIRNRIDRYGVSEPDIRDLGNSRIAIELPGLSDPDRAIDLIKKTGQLEFKLVDGETRGRDVIFFNTLGGQTSQSDLAGLINKVRSENHLPENYSAETVLKINGLLKDRIPEQDEIAFELTRDEKTGKVLRAEPYLIEKKAEVTGDMLEDAKVTPDSNENRFEVGLRFNKNGAKRFGELTKNNVGRMLAIVLDGNVNKAPVIQDAIMSGEARITLGYGYERTRKLCRDLVLVLREGALPATLYEATKSVVGPTLGRDSIRQGIHASILAAICVFLFMMIYYKLSGLFANIALTVNIILLLAILALFGATLTLPGIAGVVLTIGIAVDANVIINERIREEIAFGRTPKAAVDNGYSNALSAVFDANITTLIAGIILYQFGTGPIRGFAVALSVGIITTLFTAIIITKLIFDYRAIKNKDAKLSI